MPEDFTPVAGRAGYGLAFDIGTTTVVGMLWDFKRGVLIGTLAETNPQGAYGADVISRITFAAEKEENRRLLHDQIVACLNRITERLCETHGVGRETIRHAVVCGNTTMSHLFAGYDPCSLATAPFQPAYIGTVLRRARELGMIIWPEGPVMLIPNIAGHVGGDITAGILATRLEQQTGKSLLIDIGTNGEIVYCQEGMMLACSTAAGPAFEGAAIYQGMRAVAGAIEEVRITEEDVWFRVIGQIPPIGICGSGLIYAVAEMKRKGLINKTGRIASTEEYARKHIGSPLCERLRTGEDGREFVLVHRAEGQDIVITQKDIREVQLAKAAIAAGIQLLMRCAGSRPEDLDRIVLAGAFGNYIDQTSAVRIGLLPEIAFDRIIAAGNTAGAGTLMAVASEQENQLIRKIPQKVKHIELAEEPAFQEAYISAMSFA